MVDEAHGTILDDRPELTVEPAGRSLLVWLARLRTALQKPPRLWQEVVLLTIGWGLYALIQHDVPFRAEHAVGRGRTLLELEHSWHIDALHPLNRWLPHIRPLAVFANYYYVAMHFLVPIGVLLWLILRHVDRYRPERRVFVIMSLVGLAVFWFAPTAPPRLVPGAHVIDTVARFHTIGAYDSGATKQAADEYASMPSLHFAWALWCATTMWRVARHPAVRYGWFLYPVLTGFDILATGNHFVLDIPAGAAALLLGYLISWASSRSARSLDWVAISAAYEQDDGHGGPDDDDRPPQRLGGHPPAEMRADLCPDDRTDGDDRGRHPGDVRDRDEQHGADEVRDRGEDVLEGVDPL